MPPLVDLETLQGSGRDGPSPPATHTCHLPKELADRHGALNCPGVLRSYSSRPPLNKAELEQWQETRAESLGDPQRRDLKEPGGETQATAGQAQMSVPCLHGFGKGKAPSSSSYCVLDVSTSGSQT